MQLWAAERGHHTTPWLSYQKEQPDAAAGGQIRAPNPRHNDERHNKTPACADTQTERPAALMACRRRSIGFANVGGVLYIGPFVPWRIYRKPLTESFLKPKLDFQ